MIKRSKKYSVFSLIKNALSYHENWQPAWRNPEIQKEYDQDDSYGDDLFPFQAESEESDDKPPSYSTGTMYKYLMRKK